MDYRNLSTEPASLARYQQLFSRCFPQATHLTRQYLEWLYVKNPFGVAVGFDAFEGDQLAAHYVCVPADIEIAGTRVRSLLSLNTATHPEYQGKGLFTKLAGLTYEQGAAQRFAAVFGVANANSTHGFVRKLGFDLVAPLEAKMGMGRLAPDWTQVEKGAGFKRVWTESTLAWRARNPSNPIEVTRIDAQTVALRARVGRALIRAYAELSLAIGSGRGAAGFAPVRLFLGLFPSGACRYRSYAPIPARFRPSPLNFIFKDLTGSGVRVEPGHVLFSFADFDAY